MEPQNKAFHFGEKIKNRYGLEEGEKIIWERIIDSLPKEWTCRFIEGLETPKDKKWVGFFPICTLVTAFCMSS